MEKNIKENIKICVNTPVLNSSVKVKKMNWKQDNQMSTSPPHKLSKSCRNSNASIDNKMNNVAKLREQFVEEIKNIELSLKESIMNMKSKISETKIKIDIITEKLRQANELLCNQSGIIYTKEQENKFLLEKVEELYEFQKKIFENMEDIFNTLNIHENLSEKLTNTYDSIILIQKNDNKMLEEKLDTLIADENLCIELNEINTKINEFEEENIRNEKEISFIETEIKAIKKSKEQQQQIIKEYDDKINELEMKNIISKENANMGKNNLISEIEKIINETNFENIEITNLDKNLSKLEIKLKKGRDNENMIKKEIEEINNKIDSLSNENKQLDKIYHEENQENIITLEKLQNKLQATKDELISVKQMETQATKILGEKNSELHLKLKRFENAELKINQILLEIKKEEELITQINKEYVKQNNEYNNKMKLTNNNIIQAKIKLSKIEHTVHEFEEEIKLLEEEIKVLNAKLETKLKKIKQNSRNNSYSASIIQHDLPNLFTLEDIGNTEKQRSRKKLYTPTLADDDLELDALSLEEQFTHLTQTSTSQTESPEKNKKFFKHSNISQPKTRKEATPRPKGKLKKY